MSPLPISNHVCIYQSMYPSIYMIPPTRGPIPYLREPSLPSYMPIHQSMYPSIYMIPQTRGTYIYVYICIYMYVYVKNIYCNSIVTIEVSGVCVIDMNNSCMYMPYMHIYFL